MILADEELAKKWIAVINELEEVYEKRPDLNAVLLLIGIRELGSIKTKFPKEEKVNLMHIAVCKLLSYSGYYELEGVDEDGWPHWKSIKKLPFTNIMEQEIFMKHHIIEYFERLKNDEE